jgi:D-aminoacyl-tRNA deacylase
MRSVVQRVDSANVWVTGKCISGIKKGVLVLLGIERGDQETDAEYLLEKIVNLRLFEDVRGKMNLSLLDIGGDMLVVSQFTVLGDCRKGRRPSFSNAEYAERARFLYEYFIDKVKERVKCVAHGEFQASMLLELLNNGPVTLILDSRHDF